MAERTAPFWRMKGVSKRYGGVRALDNVDFECVPGRIHAVLGENGAGKSTLIKIIAGVVQPDDGQLEFLGQPVELQVAGRGDEGGHRLRVPGTVADARPDGRGQYLHHRSAAEIRPDRLRRAQRRRAEELLKRARLRRTCIRIELVKNLPLSRRQMVEIAKALGRKPKMLILDEATSALTAADVSKVYPTLKMLREDGLAILYISHRMHEIAELADDLLGVPQRPPYRDLRRRAARPTTRSSS